MKLALLLCLPLAASAGERALPVAGPEAAARPGAASPAAPASLPQTLAPSPVTAAPALTADAAAEPAAAQASGPAALEAVRSLSASAAEGSRPEGASASGVESRLEARYDGAAERPEDASPVPSAGEQTASPARLAPAAATTVSRPASRVSRAMQTVLGGEGVPPKLAGLAFAWSLLTIMTYSIIGPVRSAFAVISAGPQMMPVIFMACAAVTGVVVAGYNRLAKRVSRRALITGTLGAFSASMMGWWAILRLVPVTPLVSGALFVWADLFGVMAVTLFWSYANEVFHSTQARKAFGFIAAGAEIGSMAGSALTAAAVAAVGVSNMLLVAAGLFSLTLVVFALMERARSAAPAPAPAPAEAAERPSSGGGLKALLSSRLLFFLGLVVFFERLVPDFSFYVYNFVMSGAFADKTAYAAAAAQFTFWQNVVSFAASLSFAALVLPRIGVAGALMSAALVNMAGLGLSGALGAGLALVVGYNAVEGLLRYTWFKSATEMVYTTVDRDLLYRAKAFIEMFVYRFARGIAGAVLLGISFLAPHLAGAGAGPSDIARVCVTLAAAVGAPIAAVWTWAAWRLGREFDKR